MRHAARATLRCQILFSTSHETATRHYAQPLTVVERERGEVESQMQSPSLSMAMVMELANGRTSMSLRPMLECSLCLYSVRVCNIFSGIPCNARRGWVVSLACLGTGRVPPWLVSYEKRNSSSNKTQRHNNFPLSLLRFSCCWCYKYVVLWALNCWSILWLCLTSFVTQWDFNPFLDIYRSTYCSCITFN